MKRRSVLALIGGGLCLASAPVLTALPDAAAASARGPRFSVVVRGTGPDVILIPGLTSGRGVWAAAIAATPGFRYHLVQIGGFDGEPVRGNAAGPVVAPVAEELARYIAAHHLVRPAIVGHSMGGTIAMMIAARHPGLVGRVLVYDMLPRPAGLFADLGGGGISGFANAFGGFVGTSMGRRLFGSLVAAFTPPGAAAERSDPDMVARAIGDLASIDLTPELPRIRVPLTVAYAAANPAQARVVDRTYAAAYRGAPHRRLVRIDHSGHMIMFDQPARFAAVLRDFLHGGETWLRAAPLLGGNGRDAQVDQLDLPLIGLMLLVASLVAMLTQRLRLPYSVGLVAAGILFAAFWQGAPLALTPQLVFTIFLPPLIFEAAIQIPWAPFRRELPLLLVLVTVGVALAAGVVAAGMHWLIGWSWLGAAFFGVLIAATDPVSVIAMFRAVPVERRLHLLVEAESLLNDAAAAVGFAVLAAIAGGQAVGVAGVTWNLLSTALGGLLCGGVVGAVLLLIAWRTEDALIELTLTTLAAWSSFLLADHFHLSGVLATLAAGLIVGNFGWRGPISEGSRTGVLHFWEYMAFLANSFVFLLIGTSVAGMALLPAALAAAAAVALALAGRAATVYPIALLFRRTRLGMPAGFQHVLWWGGLRGALALALALALPATIAERAEIITVSFAVVAVSIFVQGLAMEPLVRRLGLLRDERDQGVSTVSTASGSISG